MGRILMMLEVSRKQDYIFANRKLSENVRRSQEISRVTDSGFFQAVAGNLFSERENGARVRPARERGRAAQVRRHGGVRPMPAL